MATPRAATRATPAADRPARQAERWLRALGDGRTGVLLLAAVGLANVVAALVPGGAAVLDGAWYGALLGTLAVSGVAAVAVRIPAAWHEWRRPTAVHRGSGAGEGAAYDTDVLRKRCHRLGGRPAARPAGPARRGPPSRCGW